MTDDLVKRLRELASPPYDSAVFGGPMKRAADRIEALERANERMWVKLQEGTLHVPHCSADHDGPVGAEGAGCSCPLGRQIRAAEVRATAAEADLAKARETLRKIGEIAANEAANPTGFEGEVSIEVIDRIADLAKETVNV